VTESVDMCGCLVGRDTGDPPKAPVRLGFLGSTRPLRPARIVGATSPEVIRVDTSGVGPSLVMRVAGSVTGRDADVLGEAVAVHGLPDRIDLSEVDSVDAEGVRAILALEARGATIVGADPYVDLILRSKKEEETQ
jgi:hypothetical protein